jgi:hypothetical protein
MIYNKLGIPLCTLNEKSRLDVAIDGADDVDPGLCLVKGGGGEYVCLYVCIYICIYVYNDYHGLID